MQLMNMLSSDECSGWLHSAPGSNCALCSFFIAIVLCMFLQVHISHGTYPAKGPCRQGQPAA